MPCQPLCFLVEAFQPTSLHRKGEERTSNPKGLCKNGFSMLFRLKIFRRLLQKWDFPGFHGSSLDDLLKSALILGRAPFCWYKLVGTVTSSAERRQRGVLRQDWRTGGQRSPFCHTWNVDHLLLSYYNKQLSYLTSLDVNPQVSQNPLFEQILHSQHQVSGSYTVTGSFKLRIYDEVDVTNWTVDGRAQKDVQTVNWSNRKNLIYADSFLQLPGIRLSSLWSWFVVLMLDNGSYCLILGVVANCW